ncbi:hypothetical protein IQ247_12225 [Plectonema cf. radiosum LEGE 06105]|uniref:Uncharacterized protein n=1 Tax=Plectonema cf. radiosum LEGE 06105 TaxID=945769 RepID=A0A8J7F3N8_9CYAN|nr:hypothetical protein [Plectonema radiosum]MBE9213423.1 hypothetical protein [Plectonema cf. radiosum LEGE 06105]
MHETQTPDDGAYIEKLNSVDSLQSSERAANPFHGILAGENKAIEVLLLAPASEQASLNQTASSSEDIDTAVEIIIDSQLSQSPQFDQETNSEHPLKDDWVAEPNAQQQAMVNAEFDKLLQLNEELRSANNQLYEQVEELTTALGESQAALQRQKKRSTVAESMFKQQSQELNAAQAQIQSLFEQLENTLKNAQRQESLAESYKGQIELNQQRLAQIERESALIQTKYNEQSQLLSQSENDCRELRTRLKRQQRQTLQFKAALEKSLETTIPGYDTLDDTDSSFSDTTINSKLSKFKQIQTIKSIQSIQPWSAPPESYEIQNDLWQEILTTSAANDSENSIPEESSTWEFSANPDIVPKEDLANDAAAEKTTEQQIVSPSDSSELEEKLDSVIQTFFSQTESGLQKSPPKEDVENSSAIIPNWKAVIEPRGTNNDDNNLINNLETNQNYSTNNEQTISFTSSMKMNENSDSETQDYWEEISHFPAFDLSENAASFEFINNDEYHTNSPSPLIYPKRPPKGRKSLSSVELPKFTEKKDTHE